MEHAVQKHPYKYRADFDGNPLRDHTQQPQTPRETTFQEKNLALLRFAWQKHPIITSVVAILLIWWIVSIIGALFAPTNPTPYYP